MLRGIQAWCVVALLLGCSGGGGGGSGGSSGSGGGGGAGGNGASGNGGGAAVDLYCEAAGGSACLCSNDSSNVHQPGEGIDSCSETSLGHGFCCKGSQYPTGTASTCVCQRFGCYETTAACNCQTSDAEQELTECTPKWTYCCAHETDGAITLCTCDNISPCSAGYVTVPNCGLSVASCSNSDIATTSCK